MATRNSALRTLAALTQRGFVDHADVEEFLGLYATALGARGIAVGKAFGFHPWNAEADIPPEWPALHTRYRHTDAAAPFLASAPLGTPYIPRKHLTRQQWRTPLLQGLLGCGLTDAVIQRFVTPWREDIYLAAYRPRGAKPISADDEALVYWLYPHLAGALATRSALRVIERSPVAGDHFSPDGHVVVTFPRLSIEWTPRARHTWTAVLGPISRGEWPRVDRMILRVATDFRNGELGARSRLLVPSLRAELAWLPARPGETHRALVMFFREHAPPAPITTRSIELLSPAQRAVAELAAAGATNAEIAARLDMAFETVRTHLREIFRRLNISRRTQLAALAHAPTRRND